MADFFDVEKFPGRRGMRRTPHVNLEWALIADGVPIDEIYAMLDTPEGIDRAFAKLGHDQGRRGLVGGGCAAATDAGGR